MDVETMKKTHYCEYKKIMRLLPEQEALYIESMKSFREMGIVAVSKCPFLTKRSMPNIIYDPIFTLEEQRMLIDLDREVNKYGEMNAKSLEIKELYAIMAFDWYGKAVLELGQDMAEMLLETELNVPFKELVVPRQSFYVVIPESVGLLIRTKGGMKPIQGVYVTYETDIDFPPELTRDFKYPDEFDSMLSFFSVARDGIEEGYSDFSYFYWSFSFGKNEEKSIESRMMDSIKNCRENPLLKQVMDIAETETNIKIVRIILNAFIYMSQPKTEQDIIFKSNRRMDCIRATPHMSKAEKDKILSNFWKSNAFESVEVGMKTVRIGARGPQGSAVGTTGPHASPVGHWRRGHWHRYRIGEGRKEVVLKWVKPVRVKGREVPEGTVYKLD